MGASFLRGGTLFWLGWPVQVSIFLAHGYSPWRVFFSKGKPNHHLEGPIPKEDTARCLGGGFGPILEVFLVLRLRWQDECLHLLGDHWPMEDRDIGRIGPYWF